MTERVKVLFIVGPTAVGKTAIAVSLAQQLNGEIISADSRQVYRRMDIGTAKPTVLEQRSARHHLIDIVDPDQELSLAEFQRMALASVASIIRRGRLPMVVGGTGQYVRAVLEGWSIPEVPPDEILRLELASFSTIYSSAALHARLGSVDQVAAKKIDYRNIRRLIRALEVYLVTGQPISILQTRKLPHFESLVIGLTRPRDILYARADDRIDQMIVGGLTEETSRLAGTFGWSHASMSSLGYPQIGAYLRKELSLAEAVAGLRQTTRRFIRHQYNWFQLDDQKIKWFDLESVTEDEIREHVRNWLTIQT